MVNRTEKEMNDDKPIRLYSTPSEIMTRIKGATPHSPILVLRCWDKETRQLRLRAVFANTVRSAQLIRNADKRVVGVYSSFDAVGPRSDILRGAFKRLDESYGEKTSE
jgi:hypothetical protein